MYITGGEAHRETTGLIYYDLNVLLNSRLILEEQIFCFFSLINTHAQKHAHTQTHIQSPSPKKSIIT